MEHSEGARSQSPTTHGKHRDLRAPNMTHPRASFSKHVDHSPCSVDKKEVYGAGFFLIFVVVLLGSDIEFSSRADAKPSVCVYFVSPIGANSRRRWRQLNREAEGEKRKFRTLCSGFFAFFYPRTLS